MAVWESRMARSRHAAFCGSRLQVVFVQLHVPVGLGQAGGDEGKGVLRVGRGLDVLGSVHIHHVEAAPGHAGKVVYIRRGVVGEALPTVSAFGHKKSPPALVWPKVVSLLVQR